MLKIILVQDFCPLKMKITQFPDGFRLNLVVIRYFWVKSLSSCIHVLKG